MSSQSRDPLGPREAGNVPEEAGVNREEEAGPARA